MKRQQGFTIIELMIATTVFSLILTVCLAGIMQITKMYYRSVTQTRTREVSRTIVDEIAEAIRFSNQRVQIGASVSGPQINDLNSPDTGYFCIGQKRYTYAIDRQVKSAPVASTKQKMHALWVDKPVTGCVQAADLDEETPSLDGKDLVPENMRLTDFSLVLRDADTNMFDISVGVAYGDDDLLRIDPDAASELTCEGAFVGVEFCATTRLLVSVEKRL